MQIIPVKPKEGLVAFCSFVLFNTIYCSSVAIYTRPDGTYRLVYPTKKVNNSSINIFHPIDKKIGQKIEQLVTAKYEEVMKNDRHNSFDA